MSFKTPEKPRNELLDMLHNLNSNCRNTNRNTRLMQIPSGPSNNQITFNTSASMNSNNFTMPGFPNSNRMQMTPSPINAPLHSSSVPALPNRNPVVDHHRISYIANQMYPNPCSIGSSPLTVNTNYASNQINALSLNTNNFQTSFSYRPNIPLDHNTPTVRPTTSTPLSQFSLTNIPTTASTKPASKTPVTSVDATSVLTRTTSVKQKRTGRSSGDLIDFGNSPTRCASSDRSDVNSVLFDFDPLIPKEEVGQRISENETIAFSEQAIALSSEAREMINLKSSRSLGDDEASSYYEHVDPFEYMRHDISSDKVYDAYDGLKSPTMVPGGTFDMPPPLPPRTSTPTACEDNEQIPSVELRSSSTRIQSSVKVLSFLLRIFILLQKIMVSDD